MIRAITENDWHGWKPLWDGYVDFYREEIPEDTTRVTFERICNRRDEMFGFVAEVEGKLVGLAHALLHRSTWTVGNACYLEDLFVAGSARGGGVARELIEGVTTEAAARGAEKLYWHTQEFNGPARSLYDLVARRVSFVVYERDLPRV
ncbi:MAG: GNAT family N-acetyltransferase [Acidimicrobiales bacterium]